MQRRVPLLIWGVVGSVLLSLTLRAVTVRSQDPLPLIYRMTVLNNDLDQVEGTAPPGKTIELWYRQRNFIEGDTGPTDAFQWCRWKNEGRAIYIARTVADNAGVWRLSGLRAPGHTTPQIFPPGPGEDKCVGGLFTEILPRICENDLCTVFAPPQLHWLNVRKRTPLIAVAAGAVSGAEQASIAVADGPNDGPDASDAVDVDQNGIDTTTPGFSPGQLVSWRCGPGGTASCPSVAVHDATTAVETDPEFPFVLGTMQGHRPGGSFIAAAAIPRGQPIGFAVNVNVRLRGRLDINLGCDERSPFDYLPPPPPGA